MMSEIAIFRQFASFTTGESVSGPTFVQPSRSRQRLLLRSRTSEGSPTILQPCTTRRLSGNAAFGSRVGVATR
jgi:hypothetical protein